MPQDNTAVLHHTELNILVAQHNIAYHTTLLHSTPLHSTPLHSTQRARHQHLDEEKPEGAENESVEQVAFADRVILNKIDLVPEEVSTGLLAR